MVLEKTREHAAESELHALALGCPVVETERLLLRPPHEDDVDDLVRFANNYEIARMLSSMPHPYFAEDAREFIERVRKASAGGCVYAITDKRTARFMGVCGLHEDPARDELPFLGYWLGEPFWGRGLATESARAMVDLFFKVTARDGLLASARTDNPASRRVIEKCGGRYWKRGTDYNRVLGEIRNLDHFLITRESWMEIAGQS